MIFQRFVCAHNKWITQEKKKKNEPASHAGEWRVSIMPIKIQLSENKSCFIEFTSNVLPPSPSLQDNYQIALMLRCYLPENGN